MLSPISSFLFVSLCGTLERGWRRRRVYNNTPRPLFSPHKPSKHTFAAPSLPWIVPISVFMQRTQLQSKPSADRVFIILLEVPRKKHQSWPIEIDWAKALFQELCKSCNFSFSFFGVRLQLYVPVTATVTIFLKLTAKQEFVPMCCLSRKEDGWRWFQFTGPCPSFWVNFSELGVARG